MRSLSTIEKCALALAAVFVLVGLYTIVRPSDRWVIYPGAPWSDVAPGMPAWAEYVSKGRSRVYGLISVAMGIGMGWATVRYGRR